MLKLSAIKSVCLLGIPVVMSGALFNSAPAQAVKCADFSTQAAAQSYMERYGVRRLDRDRDGIACESLPKVSRRSPEFLKLFRSPTGDYRVVNVGDGDTIRVIRGNNREALTVRLACIDAPEMRQGIYGAQASRRLKQLLPVGQRVNLKIGATDRYGRKVAEVIRNGRNINLQMVQEGQAVVYRRYLSTCSQPIQQELIKSERLAQRKRLGFWQQSNPTLPEVYRRMQRR